MEHLAELETKARAAGGASVLSVDASGHVDVQRVRDVDRGLVVSAPLGVEIGEAWNRPIGDTWRHELALNGTIGGVRLG